ncbi:MAG: MopE-related protein [Chitinophagales bacterium]|nr:MopE-related protein [Chitinophagales bacterium]MDW8428059.1 MopE-related protein [Chitinophagales bacterium]
MLSILLFQKRSLTVLIAGIHCLSVKAQTPQIVWQKCFGGSKDEESRSMILTSGGGYAFAGFSSSTDGDCTSNQGGDDVWVVNVNASNQIIWQRSLGGTKEDWGRYIVMDTDSNFLVCGHSFSSNGHVTVNRGLQDVWILKLRRSDGTLLWQHSYGGSDVDIGYQIQPTADGGYILVGGTVSNNYDVSGNHGKADIWLVKLNSNRNIMWQRCFGGTEHEEGSSVQITPDGGYVISGFGNSVDGDLNAQYGGYDAWIIRTDAQGNILWQRAFGGSQNDGARDVRPTPDGGYIVTGFTNSNDGLIPPGTYKGNQDIWVWKLNAAGELEWQRLYGGSGEEYSFSIEVLADNSGYLVAGYSSSSDGDLTSNKGSLDVWVFQIDLAGNIVWQRSMGGSVHDRARVIRQVAPNEYLVNAYVRLNNGDISGNHGGKDVWNVRICVPTVYYQDADGDGYGTASVTTEECSTVPPAGFAVAAGDCNDNAASIHPAAYDACNSVDDNCNGMVDENSFTATTSPSGTASFCQGASLTLTASPSGYQYQWLKNGAPVSGATNQTYTTSSAADYAVQVFDAYCSSTSATVTVSKISKPPASITPLGNLDICTTGSVTLQANNGTGLSYQWFKGSKPISGATQQTYTATKTGTYKVQVTNAQGCSKKSTGVTVTSSCRLADRKVHVITLFPNPATGKVWIEFHERQPADGEIWITDIGGKLLAYQRFFAEESLLGVDLPSTATGMLYVTVAWANGKRIVMPLLVRGRSS